jgi:chitinase
MTEVGSNSMYCRKGFQSACCETDTSSMELYGKCHWGPAPDCFDVCAAGETFVAHSATGSGGAICKKSPQAWDLRPYCCSAQEENSRWGDCQLYESVGFGPAKQGFCRSGCPTDRIRVAMEGSGDYCKQGAMSTCCTSTSQTVTKELTLENLRFRAALETFLSDREGYCSNDQLFGKTPLSDALNHSDTIQGPMATYSHDKIRSCRALRW